jgi:lipoprotein NlpI
MDYNSAIRLTPNDAVTYRNRGIAYGKKGDYDRAIQDYNEAIRLNPNDPIAYNDRGIAYRNKRDYDRAIQNYTEAIRLEPNDDLAYYNRGHQHFYKGEFSAAALDLTRSVELQHRDIDVDRVIWLYLAERRAGHTGGSVLERRTATLKLDKWRHTVVEFLLDRMTERSLFRAADDRNPVKQTDQMCEANYFAAQAKLIRGAVKDAVPQLLSAAADCSRNLGVLAAAQAELKRLQAK